MAAARSRALDGGDPPRGAPALRPARTLRRWSSRWYAYLTALGVPRAHGRLGARGRSRVRDAARPVLRAESRGAGSAHLRPRREGRDVPVRRRAPRRWTRSSSSPGCSSTSPTRAMSPRGTMAGMPTARAGCGRRPCGSPPPAALRGRPARVSDVSRAHAARRVHHPDVGDRPDPRPPSDPRGLHGPRRRAKSAIDAGRGTSRASHQPANALIAS